MSLVSKRTPHAHGSSERAIPTSIYINQNAVNAMSLPWIIYDPIKPDKCTNFYKTISRWLKSRNIRNISDRRTSNMCENSISDDTFIWLVHSFLLLSGIARHVNFPHATAQVGRIWRCACMRDSDFVTHMPKQNYTNCECVCVCFESDVFIDRCIDGHCLMLQCSICNKGNAL